MLAEVVMMALVSVNPTTTQVQVMANAPVEQIYVYLDHKPIMCGLKGCRFQIMKNEFDFNITNLKKGEHQVYVTIEKTHGHVEAVSSGTFIQN